MKNFKRLFFGSAGLSALFLLETFLPVAIF